MTIRTAHLHSSLKAYDFRGRVGEDLDEDQLFALGWGTAEFMRAAHGAALIVIGSDMRPESPAFAAAAAAGAEAAGLRAVLLGLCSTDQLYYASGAWNVPGMMITASHNPAGWNGVKICGPRASGVTLQTGLSAIADTAATAPAQPAGLRGPEPDQAAAHAVARGYAGLIRELTGLESLARELHVVVDCGNGMAGKLLPEVFGEAAGLDPVRLTVDGLYTELDGTFPNHPANPLDPANLLDVQRAVVESGADIGLAFDGDADRCFMIDETGRAVSASAIGALVARREIARARAGGEDAPIVLHNAVTSRSVPETVQAAGGVPMRTPVGHSGIKALMAEHSAVFACEHSAHFYFRDFFGADTGMLAACHVLAELSRAEQPLSALLHELEPYAASGEINSVVQDPDAALQRFREAAAAGALGEGEIDELDGVSLRGEDFWCNVRRSNTEPLVRINCETASPESTDLLSSQMLAIVRSEDPA